MDAAGLEGVPEGDGEVGAGNCGILAHVSGSTPLLPP